jgi:beta-galactosidase/beta-glucuronidase
MLTGPVTYTTGPGRMTTGNWEDVGLRDYSGMVRYRQEISLPEVPPDGRMLLDLGDVRGSAEVRVNGTPAGTCVVAPFRVDITDAARSATGSLTIEVDVANTLGPYLDATSPTPFVLGGQTISGLFGPVRLLHRS